MFVMLAASRVDAEPTPADKSLATELFRQGRALLDEGSVAQACRKLEESQRLDPGGGTLLNLALCHEREQRTATAWSEFTEALGIARRDNRTPRIELAESHIKSLEPTLSRLVVSVPAGAETTGLQVKRDGSVLGRAAWGVAMPVDPGEHVIEASAPGKIAWKQTIAVGPNADVKTVTLTKLDDAPVAAVVPAADAVRSAPLVPPSDERHVTSGGSHRAAAWTSLGLGVVGLGVGGAFGVSAWLKKKDSDKGCEHGCTAQASQASDVAVRNADFATVGFAVGVVGVGLSVVLFATDSKKTSAQVAGKQVLGIEPEPSGGAKLVWRRAF
jgi:hypothetical protein